MLAPSDGERFGVGEEMAKFYKYRERDFRMIHSYDLQEGDEIGYGYGGDMWYGVITDFELTKIRGEDILIQFDLPDGALIQCDPQTKIAVFWENGKHLIQVAKTVPYNSTIMVKR